jgi:hypothetical protein
MAYKYSQYFTVNDVGTYDDASPKLDKKGGVVGFRATITATPVTADVWRFIKVPAGAKIISLHWTNTDLGTDCPGTLGWETTSAACFSADVVWESASGDDATATLATAALLPDAVVSGTSEYLSCTIGTVVAGASGTVTLTGAYTIA